MPRSLWLRPALIYPIAFVGPWVALSWVLGDPSESGLESALGVTFWGVFVGGVWTFLGTVVLAIRRHGLATRERWTLVGIGLVTGAVALVAGMWGWMQAAERDCTPEAYECPI